jgi:serine O-acetyltransferase
MGILQIIKEDLSQPKAQDPAYRSCVDLIFNYPGVWAVVNHRFVHTLWNKKWYKLARMLAGISNFLTRVDLHPAAVLGRRVFIDHANGIVIGETTIIGDDCLIYQGVTLGGVSLDKGKRHPTLENGVVVGAGAKILGNITIGAGSKIGANSVVVKDVPPHSTAVGIPAKCISSDNRPFEHNKLPDITKELLIYLIDRIESLGCQGSDKIILDKKYQEYIKSIKE